MILAISSMRNLRNSFGVAATSELLGKFESWRISVLGEGQPISLVLVDDDLSLAAVGAPPTALANPQEPNSIRNTISILRERFFAEGNPLDTVVLLGGPRIIPHFYVDNPIQSRIIDPDSVVPSDQPYATFGSSRLVLARIPDDGSNSARNFLRLLENLTNYHTSRPSAFGSFLLINEEWSRSSITLTPRLDAPINLRLAPGWQLTQGRLFELNARYLHFNLHGFATTGDWKGFNPNRSEFVTAVDPQTLSQLTSPSSTIFCANCYGGSLEGLTPDRSCALTLLFSGASCVVAASGLVFGSHFGPVLDGATSSPFENADQLALDFWTAIDEGTKPAVALRNGLDSLATSNDLFAMKTSLQFMFLGDPTLF